MRSPWLFAQSLLFFFGFWDKLEAFLIFEGEKMSVNPNYTISYIDRIDNLILHIDSVLQLTDQKTNNLSKLISKKNVNKNAHYLSSAYSDNHDVQKNRLFSISIFHIAKLQNSLSNALELLKKNVKIPISEKCNLNVENGIKKYCNTMGTKQEQEKLSKGNCINSLFKMTENIILHLNKLNPIHLNQKERVIQSKNLVEEWLIYYWAVIYLPQFVENEDLRNAHLDFDFFSCVQKLQEVLGEFEAMLSISFLSSFLWQLGKDESEVTVISIGSCGIKEQQVLPSILETAKDYSNKKIAVFLIDEFDHDKNLVILDQTQWKQISEKQWRHLTWQNLTIYLCNGNIPFATSIVNEQFFPKFKAIVHKKTKTQGTVIISQHKSNNWISPQFFSFFDKSCEQSGSLFLIGQSGFPPIIYNASHCVEDFLRDQYLIIHLFPVSCNPVLGWISPSKQSINKTISFFEALLKNTEKEEEEAEILTLFSHDKIKQRIYETLSKVELSIRDINIKNMLN